MKIKPFVFFAALFTVLWLFWRQQKQLNRARNELTNLLQNAELQQQIRLSDSLLLAGEWDAASDLWQLADIGTPEFRAARLKEIAAVKQTESARQEHNFFLQKQARESQLQENQSQQDVMVLRRQMKDLEQDMSLLRDSVQYQAIEYLGLAKQKDSLLQLKEALLADLKEQVQQLSEELQSKTALRFKSPSGVDILYFGSVLDGQPHGYGIGFYANGTRYEGNWEKGEKHGRGVYTYPEGECYEGDFVRNKRKGYGTYTWRNGDTYHGYWSDDMRNGEGVIKNQQGQVLRSGIWKNDKLAEGKAVNL